MTGGRAMLASVGVVGGGAVALLAALAIARALPCTRVLLIDAPVGSGDGADHFTLLHPTLVALHTRVGVDDEALVRGAGATPWLGTRMRQIGPRGDEVRWIGHGGLPIAAVGSSERMLSQALADAGRFPSGAAWEQPCFDPLDFGWCVNAERHRGLLARALAATQVERVGALRSSNHDAAGRTRVTVDGHPQPLTADLWIDATGGAPRLASEAAPRIMWSVDLSLSAVATGSSPHEALADTLSATATGVQWHLPPTANLDAVRQYAGACTTAGYGRVASAWVGDTIALGDAFAMLPPVLGLASLLAARQLETLLALLPGRDVRDSERREINRRMVAIADELRDAATLVQHFLRGEPGDLPAMLGNVQHCYGRHAFVPYRAGEALPREAWRQLLALGAPAASPATICAMPEAARAAATAAARQAVAAALAASQSWTPAR